MGWLGRLLGLEDEYGPDEEVRVFSLPIKSPEDHQTAGDILDHACKKHGATYEITRPVGEVVVDIKLADGHSVVSGRGATTMEAVKAAVRKLGAAS